ncbi:MAG: porin family protein [Candidatus Latescibacteria bacterium]|nr:porin family protein [Candidatus Latescibacterota bacterium]
MGRSWWVFLLVLLALGAARAGAAERPYVIKVSPTLVYLDVGAQQGAAVGEIYAVFRPDEGRGTLVGLVTVIRLEERFCIAEIGYRTEGEQFELLQRAMPLEEWEIESARAPAPPAAAEDREEEQETETGEAPEGRWDLQLNTGLEWSAKENESERTLGVALGLELSERLGLDLGLKLAGELPYERSQYIGELSAKFFPFGESVRPYVGGGISVRQLSLEGQTAIKWGGQVLGGVAVPLGEGWRVTLEGGYQRVAVWSGLMDLSGTVAQLGVGVRF